MRGLEKTPVPAAELEARKTYLTGAFPLQIETPDGIAGKVLEAMKYGLRPGVPRELPRQARRGDRGRRPALRRGAHPIPTPC